jgi:long-chain acyl-CoA synthetase
MSGSLALLLDEAARAHARRPASLFDGDVVSYAELDARAARFAGLLRSRGARPGDRVGILLPNVPDYVAAYYGALRLGTIVVPLNALLRAGEVGQRLADAEARLLVAPPERHEELAPLSRVAVELVDPAAAAAATPVSEVAPREPDETAIVLYTSGTTGGAKGAELTHGGMRWCAEYLARPLLRLTPEDVIFGSAPLTHVLGQTGIMNAAIVCGSAVALIPRFEPRAALELMAATGTTTLLGVPTMCIALLEAAESAPVVPRLRVLHSGGAPLAVETLRAFSERFGCTVLEGYGLTETSGGVAGHHFGQPYKPGSVGLPFAGVELRIAGAARPGEVGEVLVHGPGLTRGYWRNPEATAAALDADGFLATGDMGYLDEDGYLYLVDRKKDTILRGGYNVYPREVEEALYAHPAVLEAAVVGVPDARLGEEVAALVVPRPGAAADPDEIAAFVRGRVAAYKYPRLVVLADELPRGPSGKILKREIDREELRRALAERRSTA